MTQIGKEKNEKARLIAFFSKGYFRYFDIKESFIYALQGT